MQASKERLASLGAALTPKAGALPKVPRFWKRKGAPGQDTEHPEGAVEGDHATTGASGSEAYYQDSREQGEPYGEHGEDAEASTRPWQGDEEAGYDEPGAQHARYESGDGQEGLGPLVRLVEALEMYEPDDPGHDPMMDSYQSESARSQLLGGGVGKQHRRAGSVGTASLGGETYTSEMNPKLRGKHVPSLQLDTIEDEFCAPPYTHDCADADLVYDQPDIPDDWPQHKFVRRRRLDWFGATVMFTYICALGFYIFVRTTKTMDLGVYTWYGVLVFVVEMLGASTTLLYGLNLVWRPVNEMPSPDEERHGLTKAMNPYHVRVLIPTYKETLEIVAKTVHAAYNAPLPYNCLRTIYVCDDGKDGSKRKWVEQMGPEIVYVSGRTRAQGEMNGKSANLNNCLSQIYPGDLSIPPNELVCIFDADQVANADFFLKMIPLFDAGDDVGMVLSPQAFHNIDVRCDVFNHSNVQFWEYAQPGYDALPFISCTGTNFLTRAVAFREAGWSPEYTLTEDYALGMELTRLKWQCRYVAEYLAIGEAPHETRNCFQQRSRWCKGHFQIVLDTDRCPLFLSGLSWFQRIMYCSGVWAYVVGALSTPFFIAVPLVTIWAGIFPIIVSWWAALGITVYFIAQFLVLNFVRNRKHVGPLWFATIANSILWWTFVKGFWRAFSGTKLGNTLTFKTTLKGGNRFMNTSIGDLWIPALTLAGLVASFAFGLHKVISQGSVVTTLSISLLWILYSMIPPFLLMWYNFIGRGGSLRAVCTVLYFVSTACGILAIVLLWLVYPRDYNYSAVLKASYEFYDAMRIGNLPVNATPSWRGSALTYEADPYGSLAGGFITGAGAGVVKNSIPIAFSTAMLAWSAIQYPKAYAKSDAAAAMANTLKWGTDYLLTTMTLDAKGTALYVENNRKLPKLNHYFLVYQVGNYTQDRYYYGRLEDMTATANPRPVYFTATANGTADLSGQYIAAFASTAMVWQQTYPNDTSGYYDTLMTAALELYGAAVAVPGRYSRNYLYSCAPTDPTDPWGYTLPQGCTAPDVAFGGSMVYWYNSTSFLDDLSWAAGWMYRATLDGDYLADAQKFFQMHRGDLASAVSESGNDERIKVNWDLVIYPAAVQLAQLTDLNYYHHIMQSDFLAKWLCTESGTVAFTNKGRAYNLYDPSLGQTMNSALLAAIYGDSIQPNVSTIPGVSPRYSDVGRANRYICYGRTQSRYILGDFGRSLVAGFGKNPPTHGQNLDAVCSKYDNLANCTSIAFSSPVPNANTLSGALMLNPETWDTFVDNRSQNPLNNDTYVSLENNAGFTSLMAVLEAVPGSYNLCLQGYGILASDALICSDPNL